MIMFFSHERPPGQPGEPPPADGEPVAQQPGSP